MSTVQNDPTVITDLIEAFRRSKTMFAAVSLGVFDRLHDEPKPAAELARQLGAHEQALELLLDACVSLRLLIKSDRGYRNSPEAGIYLRQASPDSLLGYIRYSDRVLWSLWANLDSAVREGTHRWDQTFGSRGALFANFFSTDESKREFLAGMHGFGQMSSPAVATAFDLSPFDRFVDLGGATGHLTIAACKQYPKLQGVVFDLPEVLNVTREYVEAAGMQSRIELAGGDFFVGPLPEGDLFALARILHDWSEPQIRQLLSAIYRGLPDNGALLIAEKLLDDDKSGPTSGLMQSLNMLVCTEGKERNLAEYTALLRAAGFQRVDAARTGKPVDAILAYKSSS